MKPSPSRLLEMQMYEAILSFVYYKKFSNYTCTNPAAMVPVKALEGCLVKSSLIILILILDELRHLTALHVLHLVSALPLSLPGPH